MLPPVGPIDVLGVKKGIAGVRRLKIAPANAQVASERYDKNPLTTLRNPEVRDIDELVSHVVRELVVTGSLHDVPGETSTVGMPTLTFPDFSLWQLQLSQDVVKVGAKTRPD